MERTFFMVKPDGVARGLVGEVISRIERRGMKLVAVKMLQVDRGLAEKHYLEHKDKPFYSSLVEYITSGPSLALVVEGKEAIKVMRTLIGATDPQEAAPGTVRGDFALDIGRNVVHASDSRDSAEREIGLYFGESEILNYPVSGEGWLYE